MHNHDESKNKTVDNVVAASITEVESMSPGCKFVSVHKRQGGRYE